jgi:hypothetical protein
VRLPLDVGFRAADLDRGGVRGGVVVVTVDDFFLLADLVSLAEPFTIAY